MRDRQVIPESILIIRSIRIFLLDTKQLNKPFSQKSCLDTCSLRQRLKVWHLHQNFSSMRSCLKGDKMHQNGNAQEKHDSTYSHIQMLNQHLQKCCRHRIVDIPIDCQHTNCRIWYVKVVQSCWIFPRNVWNICFWHRLFWWPANPRLNFQPPRLNHSNLPHDNHPSNPWHQKCAVINFAQIDQKVANSL